MKTFYNLNHEKIRLADFPCGKTQNISVKIGRYTIMLDVTADVSGAYVQFYDRLSPVRGSYSKYAANITGLHVKRDAIIDRDFAENRRAIFDAQTILKKFPDVLK